MDSDKHSLLFMGEEDARMVLDWQQSRFHHIQSLSQGFIGGLIALLAVITTILVGFTEISLDLHSASFDALVSFYPVGNFTLAFFLIFNLFILFLISFLALVSILSAFSKLLGVLTSSGMENGFLPKKSQGLISGRINSGDILGQANIICHYQQVISTNQFRLRTTYRTFVSGALRAVFFSILLLSSLMYYYYLFDLAIYRLMFINFFFGVLPVYSNSLWEYFIYPNREKSQDGKTGITFGEKIILNEEEIEEYLALHPAEDKAVKMVYMLSGFAFLTIMVGSAYNAI